LFDDCVSTNTLDALTKRSLDTQPPHDLQQAGVVESPNSFAVL